jgi:hypothetical protein
VEGDTIYLNNHMIICLECIKFLNTQQCVNAFYQNGNIIVYDDLSIGDTINIELSLLHLSSIGYYENTETFINKNPYYPPSQLYYIRNIDCFSSDNNTIINSYSNVILLIDVIKQNAKHCYSETEVDFSLIFREDKALLLPFIYEALDIQQISNDDIGNLKIVIEIFEKGDSKEKLIFINELIDFLTIQNEDERFKFLLSHIAEFIDRANNAYQYYIRNFSYNTLKTELDNAALEYAKKIQSVINDAQTKLIAIPTAFVLATANMDFSTILSSKNIGILCSLFVFAWLIELFIRNQKSALKFIESNIQSYKSTFTNQNDLVAKSFSIVDAEKKKQKRRLTVIQCITWGTPILLLILSIILWYNQICHK